MLSALWNRFLTIFRPDRATLEPYVDFDNQSGTLSIRLEGIINEKRFIFSRNAITKGKGTVGHRRFQFDSSEQTALLDVLSNCQWVNDSSLICPKTNVPSCLSKLRSSLRFKQSPSAEKVGIHPVPLEHRTYLELDDPETLIVRQNFVSQEGHTIHPSETVSEESPDWLRVGDQFFKTPQKTIRQHERGRRVAPGVQRLTKDEVPEFLTEDLQAIRKGSRIFSEPGASELRVVTATPAIATQIDLDESTSQVVVQPKYVSGPSSIDHLTLKKYDRNRVYLRRDKTYHKVDWAQIDRITRALHDAGLNEQPDGSYRAPALHYDEIINIFSGLGILSETEIFKRFRERLFGFTNIEALELPSNVRAGVAVRKYQHHGYEWLAFLKRYGLPGILADEMGLGKTLQALLTMAYYRDQYDLCPSLVVCPAALVEKWADEAEKFLSDFSALCYMGPNRKNELQHRIAELDMVVTSYDTLARDADVLKQHPWRFLIVDEAQRIKNPDTQRAQAVRKIPAEARIVITGTPVENRLRDLWALFDFLATGYLGSEGEFDRKIAYPIEQKGDRQAQEILLRKTRPFVLRRLKKAVASELPDKIEERLKCELSDLQRTLYKAVITRDLEEAIKATGGKKLSLGNPHIFAVLTRLKQICCHPGLVTGEFQEFKEGVSGKFDVFIEILDEILESESQEEVPNKLLVFSQCKHMVSFLQDFIVSRGRKCDRIDGSVPPLQRPALCRDFNADPSRFGMVLTLSSGGVGLDLQSANHVFLYDQWWNPAVHSQAIDRVHRIGQERKVLVFTIITRGTLEEKIEAKLAKKQDIFELAIRPDELLRKEITREELIDLVKLDS